MYYGIDLGGTKIEGVVLHSLSPETIVVRQRIPTEASGGYQHILTRIANLIRHLEVDAGHQASVVGIGTPGTLDPATGTLKNSNTLCLNGKPLVKDLEDILGIPVMIANDANCFALAETQMGVVAHQYPEARVVFGVIMGTGVGGGIVVNGKGLHGHHGIAGEWGHMWLDDEGEDCYCGRHGCVETILSGPALSRYYTRLTGMDLPLETILERKDPAAAQVKQRLLHFFGKSLAQVINLLDPDVIVLGGGLSRIPWLYTEGRKIIAAHVFHPDFSTPVVPPELGDSAGVFGAALVSKNNFHSNIP